MIPGDGIGPEVIEVAVKVLSHSGFPARYLWLRDVGFSRYKKEGRSISTEEMGMLRQADAILKGPLQTPKSEAGSYRSLTLKLRRELNLYANVRPFKGNSVDTIVVRENTEDLYVGRERLTEDGAIAEREITTNASLRIHRFAFDLARRYGRKRVTCVHKSNVLVLTDGLFLRIFWEVARKYADLTADEVTVDVCAYRIQKNPGEFDMLVTPNLYGDILSDQLAGAVGSLGLCGSMNVGSNHALFEPIHGTAPDIANRGQANPIGAIIAASMMARYLGDVKTSEEIDQAIRITLKEGMKLTPDLGGTATTVQLTEMIIQNIKVSLNA